MSHNFFALPLVVASMATDPSRAQRTSLHHERFAAAGDLEGIMSNVADDIVVVAPGSSLVQGKLALKKQPDEKLRMWRSAFVPSFQQLP